ncbi:expressed unknown protein [Seminavis robusta]|uniref:Uncharacterized protein n=1 Tax=Seminavis robusta TaxID=568900 RepID=A0A9N8DJJ9_9STRA|nr:expressed unknown protein [Seminavis robusta]|eukprot:Sro188_g081170.1 n/a (823) ;mRNA; f:36306-38861
MPRFGLSSSLGPASPPGVSSPPPVSSPQFSSPELGTSLGLFPSRPRQQQLGLPGSDGPSVRLCCSSGDSGAIFSLAFEGEIFYLERRTLPLYDESNEPSTVHKVRLPEEVQEELQLNPPVELFNVEADKPKATTRNNTESHESTSFSPSLLCVYSRHNVFYLEMKMDPQGEVIVEARRVFEQYFLYGENELRIVKIRPAPQRRMDFATLCPEGAMAMLTYNKESHEYSLVLQHSADQDLASVPLSFLVEESYDPNEVVEDFCFAQSGESKEGGLSLLSTLSVLFLKASGEVNVASPILFDGSVVHKSLLMNALDFLDFHVQTFSKDTAKGRRARAAKTFLKDAFGDPENQNKFMTANVLSHGPGKSAVSWPVSLQGPLLSPVEDDSTGVAIGIENFPASDLIGVAIGRQNHAVNLNILSPSTILPRFRLESDDRFELDDSLGTAGAVVQRLVLREEENNEQHEAISVALVRDPVMETMLHYVTRQDVTTLNTTAVRAALCKIQGSSASTADANKEISAHTSAWTSVQASSANVEGVVIGDDPRFGHALFVRLSNGSLVAENLTESRYLHEMEHLVNPLSDTENAPPDTTNDPDNGQPLHQVLDPMLKKIAAGLSNMGKIVGSQTRTTGNQMTPEMLAVAIAVKERCDNEVVLPMLELKQTIRARKQALKVMLINQMKELAAHKKTLKVMQDRMKGIQVKAQTALENSQELAKRSDAILQASQDLLPSLTQAEYDYIQQLKRLQLQLGNLEKSYGGLDSNMQTFRGNIDDGRFVCNIQLEESMQDHATKLLDGEEKLMTKYEAGLQENEKKLQMMARQTGVSE